MSEPDAAADSMIDDMQMKILSGGRFQRSPFGASITRGVNIHSSEDWKNFGCDLGVSLIPFANASPDNVTAFDFIKHIPRVVLMDERIRFPFMKLGCDPTHAILIAEELFLLYFCSDQWAYRIPTGASWGERTT
jgi:hypothetical protein